jgi:hypothetical protein
MKIDEHMTVIMEKDGWPGDVGDSCAETARLAILSPDYFAPVLSPNQFIGIGGFLRHPTAPEGWRESDFSNDQLLPLILATGLRGEWWKIPGTKTIVSPGVWFAARASWRGLAETVRLQNTLFAMPYRWSDSKKWFERSSGSSADYLNYFVSIVFLRRMGIWIEPRPETEEKIRSYYANEPNSAWLLDEYRKHFWIQIPKPLSFPTP